MAPPHPGAPDPAIVFGGVVLGFALLTLSAFIPFGWSLLPGIPGALIFLRGVGEVL